MATIHISNRVQRDYDFEFVERKGIGHPDTLCDAIAERTSNLYARYCQNAFGGVPHHWFDKVMLVGAESEIRYSYGRLVAPFQVIFAGKAVRRVGSAEIPLDTILHEAACQVFKETLVNFDPSRDLVIENRTRDSCGPGQSSSRYRPESISHLDFPGSPNLTSNDCNICVGFAPLSQLEAMVLGCDAFLSSFSLRQDFPFLGSDIKILGTRRHQELSLLVNIPFIANSITSFSDYLQKKDLLHSQLYSWIAQAGFPAVTISLNPESKHNRAYLTVTGTVADTGDVGVSGRGNRINGLITPSRPMSIESAAGKNPLDHTGKLYSIMAHRIAKELANELSATVLVTLCSAKGGQLSEPDFIGIEIGCETLEERAKNRVAISTKNSLAGIADLSSQLLSSNVVLW
jgi:S-adenosylmethionine synthetase